MAVRVAKHRDPYLGSCWVVECPWHGAIGRFKTEAEAEPTRRRHTECPDVTEFFEGGSA